jgi:hypothetical protein
MLCGSSTTQTTFALAVRVAAVRAQLAFGDVVADTAQAELVLNVQDGLRQVLGIVARGAGRLPEFCFADSVSQDGS